MLKLRYFLFISGLFSLTGLIFIVVAFGADDWAVFEFHTNPDYTMKNVGGTLTGVEYPKNSSYCKSEYDCGFLSLGLWSLEICATFPVVDYNIRPTNERYYWPKKPRAYLYACDKLTYTEKEITNPKDSEWKEKKPFQQMFQYIEVTLKEFGAVPGFQVPTVIGLITACFGLIFGALYIRSAATNITTGIISCSSLLITGIVYWDTVSKVFTILKTLKGLTIILKMSPVRMPTPWCLIVGGIGATLELCGGIVIFGILIMNIKNKEARWCCCGPDPKDTFVRGSKPYKGEIKPQSRQIKQEKHQKHIHGMKRI